MKQTNQKPQQDWEKTIKLMWDTNVASYPVGSTADEAYKHGWENGFRFAIGERTKLLNEIREKADKLWLSPPWSPEWNDEVYKIEGYRRAVKDIINIIKNL